MITILRERGYKSFYETEEGQFFLYNNELYLKVFENDVYNALSFETNGELKKAFFTEDEKTIPVDVRISFLERKE